MNQSLPPLSDEEADARMIRAALDAPARPLRGDQMNALLQKVAQRRPAAPPLWAPFLLACGLLTILFLGWSTAWNWPGLLQLALLIPLANLALSPLAAYLIVRSRKDPHP